MKKMKNNLIKFWILLFGLQTAHGIPINEFITENAEPEIVSPMTPLFVLDHILGKMLFNSFSNDETSTANGTIPPDFTTTEKSAFDIESTESNSEITNNKTDTSTSTDEVFSSTEPNGNSTSLSSAGTINSTKTVGVNSTETDPNDNSTLLTSTGTINSMKTVVVNSTEPNDEFKTPEDFTNTASETFVDTERTDQTEHLTESAVHSSTINNENATESAVQSTTLNTENASPDHENSIPNGNSTLLSSTGTINSMETVVVNSTEPNDEFKTPEERIDQTEHLTESAVHSSTLSNENATESDVQSTTLNTENASPEHDTKLPEPTSLINSTSTETAPSDTTAYSTNQVIKISTETEGDATEPTIHLSILSTENGLDKNENESKSPEPSTERSDTSTNLINPVNKISGETAESAVHSTTLIVSPEHENSTETKSAEPTSLINSTSTEKSDTKISTETESTKQSTMTESSQHQATGSTNKLDSLIDAKPTLPTAETAPSDSTSQTVMPVDKTNAEPTENHSESASIEINVPSTSTERENPYNTNSPVSNQSPSIEISSSETENKRQPIETNDKPENFVLATTPDNTTETNIVPEPLLVAINTSNYNEFSIINATQTAPEEPVLGESGLTPISGEPEEITKTNNVPQMPDGDIVDQGSGNGVNELDSSTNKLIIENLSNSLSTAGPAAPERYENGSINFEKLIHTINATDINQTETSTIKIAMTPSPTAESSTIFRPRPTPISDSSTTTPSSSKEMHSSSPTNSSSAFLGARGSNTPKENVATNPQTASTILIVLTFFSCRFLI